jgi:hypothetical protein
MCKLSAKSPTKSHQCKRSITTDQYHWHLIHAFSSPECSEQHAALLLGVSRDGVSSDERVGAKVDVEVEDARICLRLLRSGQCQRFVAVEFRMLKGLQEYLHHGGSLVHDPVPFSTRSIPAQRLYILCIY